MKLFTKETLSYDYVLSGLYLFYIGIMLHDYVFRNDTWTRMFSVLGLALIFLGFCNLKKSITECDRRIKSVYFLLIFICIFHVVIGVPFCNEPIRMLLFNPQYLWLFVVPLALILPIEFAYIGRLIKWCFVYVLTSLVFSLYCFNDFFFNAEYLMKNMVNWEAYVINRPQEPAILLYPITAFFVFFSSFKKRWETTIIIAMLLAIGAGMSFGRRSATAILILLALLPILVFFFQSKKRVLIGGGVLILASFTVFSNVSTDKVEMAFEEAFPILANRIDADSRSGVEEDFYEDMDSAADWIFGRGLNGTYRSPTVSHIDRLNRTAIETGYLNIILHGGLLMLIPYLVLLLYASYMGFCCSNSFFLKCCAGYVFMHIAMLYPEGTPKLTLDYFILFVFIRLCISKEWRLISDSDVKLKIHQYLY